MALNIMQKIKPAGDFPAVDAVDVAMPDGQRLTDVLGTSPGTTPETDAKFFDIGVDGLLSLKPKYRGACTSKNYIEYGCSDLEQYDSNGKPIGIAGSKNHELPETIVIPSSVNGITVTSFGEGMFFGNLRVKRLTIPGGLTAIPKAFCYGATNLEEVNGTENVLVVGASAFSNTSIKKAFFPSVQELSGNNNFNNCTRLVYVELGSGLDIIPQTAFKDCGRLSAVRGAENVTSVGKNAFISTKMLRSLSFIPKLTSIGDCGFHLSRLNYDWWNDTNQHGAGNLATPRKMNPIDYWSGCTYTACKTPMRSLFEQGDPRWGSHNIGGNHANASSVLYGKGCSVVCAAMVYSALMGVNLTSPEDFVQEALEKGVNLAGNQISTNKVEEMLNAVGLSVDHRGKYTTANLQDMYNALANGALVIASIYGENGQDAAGHAVVIHGITAGGEVLVTNPVGFDRVFSVYEASQYAIPIQNMAAFVAEDEASKADFMIVRNTKEE